MLGNISGVNPIRRILRFRNLPHKTLKERVDEVNVLLASVQGETAKRIDTLVGYPHPDMPANNLGMDIDARV